MLLLKKIVTTYYFPRTKEDITCYELISYPFLIIIGLQKYGFSLKRQTKLAFFWFYPVDPQAST
ncbi:MAG: hypothetical protein EOM31_04985 [Bacteroidia bacterium]|nr:hypothetical protein [Bacteroidia bacterium]